MQMMLYIEDKVENTQRLRAHHHIEGETGNPDIYQVRSR
jgi:hypothetical protein